MPSGHTDTSTINLRRPLTPGMIELLRRLGGTGLSRARMSGAERNMLRAAARELARDRAGVPRMSYYATAFAIRKSIPGLTRARSRAKRLTRAKIKLGLFLSPDSHWPFPHTIEQAFETFRWLVRSGDRYRGPTGYPGHHHGPRETLSLSSGANLQSVAPIVSLADLRARYVAALFSHMGGAPTERWRAEKGIRGYAVHWLKIPHFQPFRATPWFESERAVVDALESFFKTGAEGRLAASPNHVHTDCRTCMGARIFVHPRHFVFDLAFGDGLSRWNEPLARSARGEPFTAALYRAKRYLDLLTDHAMPHEELVAALNAAKPADDGYGWIDHEWVLAPEGVVSMPRYVLDRASNGSA